MLVTFSIPQADFDLPLEVSDNTTALQASQMLEPLLNIPASQQQLVFNGRAIPGNMTLQSVGVKQFDVVLVGRIDHNRNPPTGGGARIDQNLLANALSQIQPSAPSTPSTQPNSQGPITLDLFNQITSQINAQPRRNPGELSAEETRDHFRNNPDELQQLLHRNPLMAEAILNDDIELLRGLLEEHYAERREAARKRKEEMDRLEADPFNPESQKRIQELIHQEQIQKNMESALELNPELFGQVVMLYIDCQVNGKPVKAFVDSGAQITLMSSRTAERCGIMHLVDRRFSNTLVGVGTCQTVGRIHSAEITIGNGIYSSSFTVVEDPNMDFLLGLDMLRRHRCCIDLSANVLRMGESKEEVPFLSEKDIPKKLIDNKIPQSLRESTDKMEISSSGSQPEVFPNDTINHLMSIGNFTREQVISALTACAGDSERAATLLFSQLD